MEDQSRQSQFIVPKQTSNPSLFLQLMPSLLLLICTVFIIVVGIRFLNFIDRTESQRVALSSHLFESRIDELKNMNDVIKQELDLILDQRKENQALQAKIQELTTVLLTPKNNVVDSALPQKGKQ